MSLLGLYTFLYPDAGKCSLPSGDSPRGASKEARGLFLRVPALPQSPGCSPSPSPDSPTRGRQRLAVPAPTLPGAQGPGHTAWAARASGGPGPPCTAHMHCTQALHTCTAHMHCRSPGVWVGWTTVCCWGLSTAHLATCGKTQGKAFSCLAHCFCCVKKWKDVVGVNFFDRSDISVPCQDG